MAIEMISSIVSPSDLLPSSTESILNKTKDSSSSSSTLIPSSSLLSLLASLPPSSSLSPSFILAFAQLAATLSTLVFSSWLLFHLPWFLLPLGWFLCGGSLIVLNLIGIDCANGCWTKNQLINRIVGEVAMMPLLQPFECLKNKMERENKINISTKQEASETAVHSDSDSDSDSKPSSTQSASSLPHSDPFVSFSFLSMVESFLFDFIFPTLPSSPSSPSSQARTRLLASMLLQYSYLSISLSFLYFRCNGWQSIFIHFLTPLLFYRLSYSILRALLFTDRMDAFIPADILALIPSYQLRSFCQLVKKNYQNSFPTYQSDVASLFRSYSSRIHWINATILVLCPIMSILAFRYVELTRPTLYLSIGYYFFTGLGITAGYHRLFAHKAYEVHPVANVILLLAGSGALEGSAKWWCGGHRVHHRYTDTVYDPYNAKGGFWYAHIGWMMLKPKVENQKKADISDLNADPFIRFQHRYYLYIGPFMAFILPTLIAGIFWNDWLGGYFYAGFVRLLFVHHSTFCVNSVAHYFGDHTFDDRRSPRDNYLTAFLTFGEGYHNFHHEFPNDYRNGILWYDYDPTKWLITALGAIGVAFNQKVFDGNTIEKGKVAMLEKSVESKKSKLVYPPAKEELKSIFTTAELERIVKETDRELVVYDGMVHDLNGWGAEHPGGKHWIDRHKGKDVTRHLSGQSGIYFHSEAAKRLLATFRIGLLVNEREEKEEKSKED